VEYCTLKRLGEEVSNHLYCGAIFNAYNILLNRVRNKVVSDVDMPSAVASRGSSIVF
jgi:hypothetical protein